MCINFFIVKVLTVVSVGGIKILNNNLSVSKRIHLSKQKTFEKDLIRFLWNLSRGLYFFFKIYDKKNLKMLQEILYLFLEIYYEFLISSNIVKLQECLQ